MLNEYLAKVNAMKADLDKIAELVKVTDLDEKIHELEYRFNAEGWNDIPALQEYNKLVRKRDGYVFLEVRWRELKDLIEILIEEKEFDMVTDVTNDYKALAYDVKKMMLENMFSGKYDANNVILSIHAGQGGKEAQDWGSMLMRMYLRWADLNGFKCNIVDLLEGEVPGGVKSATLEIIGENAFGMLKNESGVHRLIRVSPFDSQNRRQTSFTAIEVIPEIEADLTAEIDMKDVKVDTFRSSGKGGQHVNKTESAIRLTHIPTGIVVECQQERSQHQNKEHAMKVLLSKLTAIKEKEHLDEISQVQGEQQQIVWGSQIRTYTFMPYQQVKDHRTGYETGNISAVMDGEINDFIFKCLAQ